MSLQINIVLHQSKTNHFLQPASATQPLCAGYIDNIDIHNTLDTHGSMGRMESKIFPLNYIFIVTKKHQQKI